MKRFRYRITVETDSPCTPTGIQMSSIVANQFNKEKINLYLTMLGIPLTSEDVFLTMLEDHVIESDIPIEFEAIKNYVATLPGKTRLSSWDRIFVHPRNFELN